MRAISERREFLLDHVALLAKKEFPHNSAFIGGRSRSEQED
jgi:hypothetical protein